MHLTHSVSQYWANDRARSADIWFVEGICAGIALALDVCEREKNIIELEQEYPFNLHEEVDAALAYLATYAQWQQMGEMLSRSQRMYLLTLVYVGQDPQDHHDEYQYNWTRP